MTHWSASVLLATTVAAAISTTSPPHPTGNAKASAAGLWNAACAVKNEGIDKVNFWVKADNGNGLAFWKRIGGIERTDLVVVSMILGDNPNA